MDSYRKLLSNTNRVGAQKKPSSESPVDVFRSKEHIFRQGVIEFM